MRSWIIVAVCLAVSCGGAEARRDPVAVDRARAAPTPVGSIAKVKRLPAAGAPAAPDRDEHALT